LVRSEVEGTMGGFQNTLPTCIKLALPRQNINPHPISYTN
jgi:hypothetical protein